MNIHTKLILNYLGIVLVILLAMYGYLDYSLKQNLSERITEELTIEANLTREFLLEVLPGTLTYDIVDGFVTGWELLVRCVSHLLDAMELCGEILSVMDSICERWITI